MKVGQAFGRETGTGPGAAGLAAVSLALLGALGVAYLGGQNGFFNTQDGVDYGNA